VVSDGLAQLERGQALHEEFMRAPAADKIPRLLAAIQCYDEALLSWTEQDFLIGWAHTQHARAIAYTQLLQGDRTANLHRAIAGFDNALCVYANQDLKDYYLKTLHALSRLYYQEARWQEALVKCDEGMRVVEGIRTAALTVADRKRLLSENVDLVDRAVCCSVELAQWADALIYVEGGKTRNLLETLTRRDIRPRHIADPVWQAYQEVLAAAQALEQQLASIELLDLAGIEQAQRLRADLTRARMELDQYEAQFRTADPSYQPMATPLTITDLHRIVQQVNAVLVAFHVTDSGTFVFLLSGDDTGISAEQVVRVPAFTRTVLNEQVVDFLLRHYHWLKRSSSNLRRWSWMRHLEQITDNLYTNLLRPVVERLQSRYPEAKRLLVIPNKGLNLLPLHAAQAGRNAQSHTLLDDYVIL